jgi:hypothetical protein
MSIYFDYFQNKFWKWSQLPPIRDQNILDSDVAANINLTFAQHLFRSIHKNYTPRLWQTQLDPYPNTIGHSTMICPAAYYESDTVDDRDVDVSAACPSPSLVPDPYCWRPSFIFISRYNCITTQSSVLLGWWLFAMSKLMWRALSHKVVDDNATTYSRWPFLLPRHTEAS